MSVSSINKQKSFLLESPSLAPLCCLELVTPLVDSFAFPHGRLEQKIKKYGTWKQCSAIADMFHSCNFFVSHNSQEWKVSWRKDYCEAIILNSKHGRIKRRIISNSVYIVGKCNQFYELQDIVKIQQTLNQATKNGERYFIYFFFWKRKF